MVFRDQMLVCDQCGATFFFTVTQQRRMAEELGHQDFEAPHLCPKCSQPEAGPAAADKGSLDVKSEVRAFEPVSVVPEPAVAPKPVDKSAPEPEPRRQRDTEPEPEVRAEPEVLPAFDEALLDEIGIKIKLIGNIKWFSRKKGFGFVTKADGEELFFHRSDVLEADLRQLRDGTQVEFQVRRTHKGLEAFDVSVLPTL
jgi:CspA family cold shock protein